MDDDEKEFGGFAPASSEALAELRQRFAENAAKRRAEATAAGYPEAATTEEQDRACAELRVEWLREHFEKWASRSGYNVERSSHFVHHYDEAEASYVVNGLDLGVYVDHTIEVAWCAFLAGDHIGRA